MKTEAKEAKKESMAGVFHHVASVMVAAFALSLATVGTTTLRADVVDDINSPVTASLTEDGPTVRILNNHPDRVYVYVVGSNQLYLLGTVGHGDLKTFEIPAVWVEGSGTVQLKVYPRVPEVGHGRSSFEQSGIKTQAIELQSDQVMELLLEPVLAKSGLNIVPK